MNLYVACEEVDFIWTRAQVSEFDRLWSEGMTDLKQLAKHFNRTPHEISFLIWDRAEKGFIGPAGEKGSRSNGGRTKRKERVKPVPVESVLCACGNKHRARGMCGTCYSRYRRSKQKEE